MKSFSFLSGKKTKLLSLFQEIDSLHSQIAAAADFISEIEKGNLEIKIQEVQSTDSELSNQLTSSLINLQKQMIRVSAEEEQRNWVAETRSNFMDILRNRNNDLNALAETIIRNLIKCLSANQGGLYLINDDETNDVYIQLLACYAYERKKYLTQRIEMGEGLVGQVVLEKEYIYLTEIPEDYLKITSGLGESTPRHLLIVPLKIEEKVYGAIEIASFHGIKDYEIEFTIQLCESIASTISNVKNNARTQQLLEDTQQQAEEMRSQGEELQQNMEELQATQEEMQRKASEIESRMTAIDESGIASIEFELDGTIVKANTNFLKLMGYNLEEIEGKHHRIFVSNDYAQSDDYAQFWKGLREGKARFGEYERFGKGGKQVYIQGSYSILRDSQGKPKSVIKLAADITSMKQAQEELQQQTEEMKAQDEELRQNLEELSATQDEMQRIMNEVQNNEILAKGILDASPDSMFAVNQNYELITFNEVFKATWEVQGKKVEKGVKIQSFFSPKEWKEQHEVLYIKALAGEAFTLNVSKKVGKNEMFFIVSYSPIKDKMNSIAAVSIIAKDITEIELMRVENERLLKEIQHVTKK
ncbi:PAS domain S-box protein [Catalinimonas niigatensis]|uniref:PAS domain S-box protein n=1 Tax=Catalinimonas niigatensis TaxID=1397264 RepID=UPI0026660599|nr:PAS domain S-box protein [Catalinimonas niigatensis]WPP49719.1 PAS domain S-box protein [Catalinimonas niigatensis]